LFFFSVAIGTRVYYLWRRPNRPNGTKGQSFLGILGRFCGPVFLILRETVPQNRPIFGLFLARWAGWDGWAGFLST